MLAAASLGHWIASIAFLALVLLLLSMPGSRRPATLLILSAAISAGWAGAAALRHLPGASDHLVLVLDNLRAVAWLGVAIGMLPSTGWPQALRLTAYVAMSGAGVIIVPTLIGDQRVPQISLHVVGVTLSVLGLTALEQAYRNAGEQARKPLLYLCFGIGGMLVYDLLFLAQSLALGSSSEMLWSGRGFAYAACVPLIAFGAKRMRGWSPMLFMSRQATFYSATLVAIGIYLLLVLTIGYVIRATAGEGAVAIQTVAYAMAAALLVGIVASRKWRRRLRVFVLKHFYRHKYDYRDEWLRFIATLSDASTQVDTGTSSVRAIAQIISSPRAVLLRYESARASCQRIASWPASMDAGRSLEEVCANAEVISLVAEKQWVIDTHEHAAGSVREGGVRLPAWLKEDGWRLIVPVLLRSDLFGVLLLADPPGHFTLTFEDRDLLKTVARHVATHLAQHEAEQRVAEAQQFEAYAKLTAFMMHDLKNSVAQLQLLVENAHRHRADPRFIEDAIDTVDNAAQRIARLIESLSTGSLVAREEEVEVGDLIRNAVESCAAREPRPIVGRTVRGVRMVTNPEKLTNAIQHIVRNAQDATPATGSVIVDSSVDRGRILIDVRDTGSGMRSDFVRERLFKPFDSTKGAKGMGVGAFQVREYARSLGGEVEVRSEPGCGTLFRIILPVSAAPSHG